LTALPAKGYKATMSYAPGRSAGAAGRREERKAENRSKLLAAARKVFAEKGLGAATARDIVRETDLATGTFYNYFRDKEDAFRALLEDAAERQRAVARETRLTLDLPLEQRVEAGFRAYFELALENRELFELYRRNAGAIASDKDLFEPAIAELTEDLREWADAGDIADVDLLYLAVGSAGFGFQIATHLIDSGEPDIDGATAFCTRFFLAGVRALSEAASAT
jgi:AcrR family transcriptional regulator